MKQQIGKCRVRSLSRFQWRPSCFSQCLSPPCFSTCFWQWAKVLFRTPLSYWHKLHLHQSRDSKATIVGENPQAQVQLSTPIPSQEALSTAVDPTARLHLHQSRAPTPTWPSYNSAPMCHPTQGINSHGPKASQIRSPAELSWMT